MDPWVWKIPWSRKWQPTPIFLPGESHGQRGLVATIYGVTSIGYDRATNYMHTYTHTHTHIYMYMYRERSLIAYMSIKAFTVSYIQGDRTSLPTTDLISR